MSLAADGNVPGPIIDRASWIAPIVGALGNSFVKRASYNVLNAYIGTLLCGATLGGGWQLRVGLGVLGNIGAELAQIHLLASNCPAYAIDMAGARLYWDLGMAHSEAELTWESVTWDGEKWTVRPLADPSRSVRSSSLDSWTYSHERWWMQLRSGKARSKKTVISAAAVHVFIGGSWVAFWACLQGIIVWILALIISSGPLWAVGVGSVLLSFGVGLACWVALETLPTPLLVADLSEFLYTAQPNRKAAVVLQSTNNLLIPTRGATGLAIARSKATGKISRWWHCNHAALSPGIRALRVRLPLAWLIVIVGWTFGAAGLAISLWAATESTGATAIAWGNLLATGIRYLLLAALGNIKPLRRFGSTRTHLDLFDHFHRWSAENWAAFEIPLWVEQWDLPLPFQEEIFGWLLLTICWRNTYCGAAIHPARLRQLLEEAKWTVYSKEDILQWVQSIKELRDLRGDRQGDWTLHDAQDEFIQKGIEVGLTADGSARGSWYN
ncbi:uncharacterized protein VTP21DRAFT_326 [Calcarisporiella thermophila]|uniref:uncharacterized protein n=1 Tax=Calcarisporiella thermophila TaxID=911321 RepID=UPI0037434960